VEDHLPGGLEALNEKLNNTSHVTLYESDNYEGYYWESYGYNYKEIRGDRVSFFVSKMSKGEHVYTYLARATRPGEFVALPAEAYAMYDDRVWGRSNSGRVVILAR
jgi:alpha-2-macroglobulin